jgi:hypothetical protein
MNWSAKATVWADLHRFGNLGYPLRGQKQRALRAYHVLHRALHRVLHSRFRKNR